MTTDPIFYRLFATIPETFFLMLGMSAEQAGKTAAEYEYEAVEFKETSHRADGVFRPSAPGLPVYFLEVQFYSLRTVFADLLVKVYTYLKQRDPGQRFCGVVLFSSRTLEPLEVEPYQALFDAGLIRRFYLDEMPEQANAPLGLSILYLIRQTEAQAPARACELISRAEDEIEDEALRADLVELIETVIVYKLPRLSREEIQAMLQVHDIRETRVYQEAREEGAEEERQRNFQDKLLSISKMAARKIPASEIAEYLGLDLELVQREIAKRKSDS